VRHPHFCEAAEAGVDAVRRRVAFGECLDHAPRRRDARAGRPGQGDRGEAVGHGEEIGKGEGAAVEMNHGRRGAS
jgi:hypothetical protein